MNYFDCDRREVMRSCVIFGVRFVVFSSLLLAPTIFGQVKSKSEFEKELDAALDSILQNHNQTQVQSVVEANSNISLPSVRPAYTLDSSADYDAIWGSPISNRTKNATTLTIVNLTSEIAGYWVEINKDRIGKTPMRLALYTDSSRKLPESITIELSPTQELEVYAANVDPDILLTSEREYLGARDVLPRNLHMEAKVLSREKIRQRIRRKYADPPTILNGYSLQIDGAFNGWEGETVVVLTNGEVWRQSDYQYSYSYSFMPKVVLFKDGIDFKMLVENTTKAVAVERLR